MSAEWYYKPAPNKVVGPYISADMKRLASEGCITSTTMVRKGTHGHWVAASKVKGLLDGETATPTTIAPEAPAARSIPPIPRLPAERKAGDDRAKLRSLMGLPLSLLISGAALTALVIVGLIVAVSLSGNQGKRNQIQALKPPPPAPSSTDLEREKQTRLAEEKRLAEEQRERAVRMAEEKQRAEAAAAREAAAREAAAREAAAREAAAREAAAREAAAREAAVREAAVREAAVREAAVREAAVREAAARQAMKDRAQRVLRERAENADQRYRNYLERLAASVNLDL